MNALLTRFPEPTRPRFAPQSPETHLIARAPANSHVIMSDLDPEEIQELLEEAYNANRKNRKLEKKIEALLKASKKASKKGAKSISKSKSMSKSSTEGIGIVTSPGSHWFNRTVYQSSKGKYIKDKDEGRVYLYSNVKIKKF